MRWDEIDRLRRLVPVPVDRHLANWATWARHYRFETGYRSRSTGFSGAGVSSAEDMEHECDAWAAEIADSRRPVLAARDAPGVAVSEKTEVLATEIKVRAERRCGELLSATEKRNGGHAMKARSNNATEVPPTLAQMGLTKDESSRYQQLAAMPDEHFETAVATAKATAGEVTTAFMLRGRFATNYAAFAAFVAKINRPVVH